MTETSSPSALSTRAVSGAALAADMGIDEEDLARRHLFVGLRSEDIERVTAIRDIVARFAVHGTDLFFDHLRELHEADALFQDAALLQQARSLKQRHLVAMAEGRYQLHYASERLDLAVLYSRVGLDVRVFLGAFHHLLGALGEQILEAHPGDARLGFRRFTSLKKVAFFDIGLIADALVYERERTIRTQEYALQSIGDGVIATDTTGRVLLMNRAASALTGVSPREAIGAPSAEVFRIFDARSRAVVKNPGEVAVRTGAVVGLANGTILVSRDGTERLIADSGAPIRDASDRIIGAVVVFRDVTVKERMEAELQRASTLDALGVLAGGIAHDFNNVLTGVLSNVSMARMQAHDIEMVRARLADAESAALGARDLTQQLLTFARGGEPVRRTMALAEPLREWTRFNLAGSSVKAVLHVPDDLWPTDVDVGQLAQVVQNLLLNAVQAMPQGGRLRVDATNVVLLEPTALPIPGGRYVRIAIADEGPGIPADVLPRIFDPFFTTKPKGTGLGLATAWSIVQKHEGHIMVAQNAAHGATFTVFLPAVVGASGGASTMVGAPERGCGRILLMDDDPHVRSAGAQLIAMLGYEVTQSDDGAAAVDTWRKARAAGRPFDALVLDLTVPGGVGGLSALQALLAEDPDVRAIVASGYSADAAVARPSAHGFCGAIRKPYSVNELADALAEAVRR